MHTILHYYYTRLLLGEPHASIAFAVDIEPAKSYFHDRLYREGSVEDLVCSLPPRLRKGVAAHLVQDAYWEAVVRRHYIVVGNIWVHRMIETMWARRWAARRMPRPPEVDVRAVEELLGYIASLQGRELDINAYLIVERILWSIYGPEEEVAKMLELRSGVSVRDVDYSVVDRFFDEDALLRITAMLAGRLAASAGEEADKPIA